MIIELFGPPGGGKTTFAHALAVQLRKQGQAAELILSYRPAERLPLLDPCETSPARHKAVVARRLARPILEVLTLARHPLVSAQNVTTALNIVRALPPEKIMRSMREVQYISRLSHSWAEASRASHIVIFDQAYVQTLCSLALLNRAANETMLVKTLEFTPKSDLLIRLEAPLEILKARLHNRKRMQSAVERLFEHDWKLNLESFRIFDLLQDLLLKRGQSVMCISSLDQRSLRVGVERIEHQLMGLHKRTYGRA
jgi:thymidylate kinase